MFFFVITSFLFDVFIWQDPFMLYQEITNGLIGGFLAGVILLIYHFRKVKNLAGQVTEETVDSKINFETILDEKAGPAMDIIEQRLNERNWKTVNKDLENGMLEMTVNKHKGWKPDRYTFRLMPVKNGQTLLHLENHRFFLARYFPDFGQSIRYLKEVKLALQ